jgi:hypothetical protein
VQIWFIPGAGVCLFDFWPTFCSNGCVYALVLVAAESHVYAKGINDGKIILLIRRRGDIECIHGGY